MGHEPSEPSAADLADIEREWPLIEAEMELLEAEITVLITGGLASELDRRRVRRAQRQVLAMQTRLTHTSAPADLSALVNGAVA